MLMGNLTRKPEIKHTPKGTAIAAFGMAINRNYTTDTGEKREEVTFVDVEAYARLAEIIGEYCDKGSPLFIEGRLKLDQWDDKQSGQKRSKMKVVAEACQLIGSKPQSESQAQQPSAPGRRPVPPPRRQPAPDPDLDATPDDIPF
jgi:single-strand DNA-binding protein